MLLTFLDRKEARNIGGHSKDREELEKEIMDVWAEKYVQRFFAPFAVSKAPVTLGNSQKKKKNSFFNMNVFRSNSCTTEKYNK